MDFWVTFWAVVLVVSAALFAYLAVVVTIGGLRDIVVWLSDPEAAQGTLDGSEKPPSAGNES